MDPNRQIILLVDDDADDLFILKDIFEEINSSCEIILARDGREALNLLSDLERSATLPSLIVLDITMPRMDGKQTIAEIKKNKNLSSIPVAVFTNSSRPDDKQYFSLAGADLIKKPYRRKDVVAALARMLSY